MGKASERRLRAMIRKADARKKSSLLVKHFVATAMGGAPLLTEIEAFEMQHSFESDEERQEYATMLVALKSLVGFLEEADVKYLEVMVPLTFLGGIFARAKEHRHFEDFLNELCLKRDGEYSRRLQDRAVAIGRLGPYFYDTGLEDEGDDRKSIVLKLSDQELTLTKEVNEALEQQASELKALIQVVRDLMKQYTTPIGSFTESIDNVEKRVRESIRLTKRLLYNTNFELWDEIRVSLLKHSDPLLAMMEALPDYDDIVFDEDLYKEKMRSVNQEIANRLKGL
jgi:uncharacterized protein (DUF2164 family)